MYDQLSGLMSHARSELNGFITTDNSSHSLKLASITDSSVIYAYPDTDRYKADVCLFFQVEGEERSNFELSHCIAEATTVIYIVVRNDTPENLSAKTMRYADCFKAMVHADESFGGAVSAALVRECKYYDGIEGSPNIKAVELTLMTQYQD